MHVAFSYLKGKPSKSEPAARLGEGSYPHVSAKAAGHPKASIFHGNMTLIDAGPFAPVRVSGTVIWSALFLLRALGIPWVRECN